MISRLIILSLIFALFAACDNGDGSGITQPETIKQYTVEVYLADRIVTDSVIISVYSKNHVLENTAKTRKNCFIGTKCLFDTAPLKFGEYAKITAFAHAINGNDTTRMEFSRFAPMNAANPWINAEYETPVLNIYTAAASEAVNYFLREKHMSYEDATAKAYDNMKDFGIADRNFEKDQYNINAYTMSPTQLPYIYTRYFLSDSVFYSDFLELQNAIRDGEWGDTLFRVRAADALVRTFKNMTWVNVPGMQIFYNYENFYPNFWENIYGMEVCNDNHIGDTLVNANRRSAFYDSVFVCGGRMLQGGVKWQHWRLREPEDAKMGICELGSGLYNGFHPLVGEIDSTIYICTQEGWKKTNSINTILKYKQVPCNAETINRTYIYNDSLYLCHGMDYSDEEWLTIFLSGARKVYCAWTGDKNIIDSVYPEGVPDSALLKNVEGIWK